MQKNRIRIAVGTGVLALLAVTGITFFLQMSARPYSIGKKAVTERALFSEERNKSNVVSDNASIGLGYTKNDVVSVSASPNGAETIPEAKVIQQGNVSIRVKDAREAMEKIRGVAEWFKGTVFSANMTGGSGNGVRSGVIVIKVPAENFTAAMGGVRGAGTVVINESMSNQDVTTEFTDMEAQLKNKQVEEEAFLKIMEKASKMDDIIAVTQELSRVRGEIEMIQGQMRYMSAQTDMAMITVTLTEDQNVLPVDTWRPWQEVKDAVSELLKGLRGFADFLIVVVVTFLPLALLYAVILFMVWRVLHWVYRKVRGE